MNHVPYVVEQTPGGERSYDLLSRLMKDRIIMLTGEVNNESAAIIVGQMLFLEGEDSEKDIQFYLNSPGGSISAGLAIYDVMNYVKCDISTIVIGQAASMGSFLAMAGTPGKRYLLPHSTHMIHQPLSGISMSQASDIEIHAKEVIRLKELLTKLIAHHSGQDYEKVKLDVERDNYMNASTSVKYGLADRIITKRN